MTVQIINALFNISGPNALMITQLLKIFKAFQKDKKIQFFLLCKFFVFVRQDPS